MAIVTISPSFSDRPDFKVKAIPHPKREDCYLISQGQLFVAGSGGFGVVKNFYKGKAYGSFWEGNLRFH